MRERFMRAAIIIAPTIAVAVISAGFLVGLSDVPAIQIDDSAKNLAKHNLLTREVYCDEAKKAIKKLDGYFTSISENNKSPPFTLNMERCEENLKTTIAIQPQPQL